MADLKYHRSELAKQQLRTAILLFLNVKDFSSVITLSSAASNILSQLVRRSGKEPFIDYACRVHDAFIGSTPKRDSYKNYIDNALGVNGTKIIEAYKNMPDKLKKTDKHKPSKGDLEKVKNKTGLKQPKTEIKIYQRFQLAANQLETAIMLFLTNTDKLSAITLAGAADVIFCELVNREGKENFTDLTLKKEGGDRSREEVGKEINDLLCINALKHFDKDDDEDVEIDIDECAVGAILKALANYNMLDGKDDKLIIAFRYWCKTNLDPEKYNLNDEPDQEDKSEQL